MLALVARSPTTSRKLLSAAPLTVTLGGSKLEQRRGSLHAHVDTKEEEMHKGRNMQGGKNPDLCKCYFEGLFYGLYILKELNF